MARVAVGRPAATQWLATPSAAGARFMAAAQRGPGGWWCQRCGVRRGWSRPSWPCAACWRAGRRSDDGLGGHPSRAVARPGLGCADGGESVVLRLDSPGREPLCARSDRTSPTAVALERYPCVPAGRWPVGAASAPRASLYSRAVGTTPEWVRVRVASLARRVGGRRRPPRLALGEPRGQTMRAPPCARDAAIGDSRR